MKETSQKTSDFPPSLAMLLGAAAGLAVGIFIGGNGANLRAEIGGAIRDIREQASELADRGIRKIREYLSGAIDEGEREAQGGIASAADSLRSGTPEPECPCGFDHTVAFAADSLRSDTPG